MNALKGVFVGLFSFLLFLCLGVFGVAFTLHATLLNADFGAAQVDRVDVSAVVKDIVQEQVAGQLPPEAKFVEDAIYQVIADEEPWLKEQARAAVYAGYDFLLGKSDRLEMVISLEPLKADLKDVLRQNINQLLPPQLAGLPPEMLEPYFDQYYQEFTGQIPSELAVDESLIPPEAMAQIVQAKQVISYFRFGYYLLIAFMVLLVIGIILLRRDVRKITRPLGISLLVYGAMEFAGVLVARNYLPLSMPLSGIPPSLQTLVVGLFSDMLAPLQAFSLSLLIGGVVLLAVSFIYRRGAAGDAAD